MKNYERLHREERWIYTLRTKRDMAVFYVGCCKLPHNRIVAHRNGKRPVSIRIREYEASGIELTTVFEERILPSTNVYTHWSHIEMAYIRGYANLLGPSLTNVVGNNSRKNSYEFSEGAT